MPKRSGKRHRRAHPTPPEQATIETLNHQGQGIAELEGKKTFVIGALPQEKVHFNYLASYKNYHTAIADDIFEASPHRVTPKCAAFGRCGGCNLQHLEHSEQLKHKMAVLKENLQHFGQITCNEWAEPLFDQIYGYRTKARLGVRYVRKKEQFLIGFREHNGRFITQMDQCDILIPEVGLHLQDLKKLITQLSISKEIPQIEVVAGDQKIGLILRHLQPFSTEDLKLLKDFADKTDFVIYTQAKGPQTIQDLNGQMPGFMYSLPDHDITLTFYPGDFTQVNLPLNQKMVNQALDWLAIDAHDSVLDLFCGLGNFTLPIARYAKHAHGIEGDEAMVKRARENATANHIDNTTFATADLFQSDWHQALKKSTYDKILLDPPRSGAEQVVQNINAISPKTIVYVSCNPATLARDAGILVNQKGYRLVKAGIIDMFAHTAHVESMALFQK